jgi:starch synthase
MHILFAASEVAPLVKVGGLADVAGALPQALRRIGHDARIVMPRYKRIRDNGIRQSGPIAATFLPIDKQQEELRVWQTICGTTLVYLLDIPVAFERDIVYGAGDEDRRFILFCRGVLALMQHLREVEGWQPDIVHTNNWQTALIPTYIKTFYSYTFGHIATVLTIHNLAYQGMFSPYVRGPAGLTDGEGWVNFLALGVNTADMINTVSPRYAQEILTPEYGEGLDGLLRARQDRLVGILNGIDYAVFDPETDPDIAANYSADEPAGKATCKLALQHECGFPDGPEQPLIGMVTQLVEQKGLDLVHEIVPWLMSRTDARLVILGTGQRHLEEAFINHMRAFPDRIHVQLRFDSALAQRVYAGADVFLMPSRYEPGGLGQLIALRYGAVPVVRATGGLDDTVREGYDGNGFRFHPYEARHLIDALSRCLTAYRDTRGWPMLRARGMRENYSWESSAREYAALYERALREIGR